MQRTRESHVSAIQAFQRGKYVYLAIPKNGLCTHSEFFLRKGWTPRHIWEWGHNSTADLVFFSHIRDPYNRYAKGLVQSLKNADLIPEFLERMKKDPTYLRYVLTSVNDDHTSPISEMFPPTISPFQVNWIPMDHPNPKWTSDFLTNQFFREYNLPYKLTLKDRTHVSDKHHRKVQDFIKNKIYNSRNGNPREGYGFFYTTVLSKDMVLYKHVMRQYKSKEAFYNDVFLEEFPDIPKGQAWWYPSKDDIEIKKPPLDKNRPAILKAL